MVRVKVDARGRMVLPQAFRRRLGIDPTVGGEVEALATLDGVALERPRQVTVSVGEDGLAVATIEGGGTIRNVAALDEISAARSSLERLDALFAGQYQDDSTAAIRTERDSRLPGGG